MKNDFDFNPNENKDSRSTGAANYEKMQQRLRKLKKIYRTIIIIICLAVAAWEYLGDSQPAKEKSVSKPQLQSEAAEALVSQDAPEKTSAKESSISAGSPAAEGAASTGSSSAAKKSAGITELQGAGAETQPKQTANTADAQKPSFPEKGSYSFRYEKVPAFSGVSYYVLNDNVPVFTAEDAEQGKTSFEYYSELDALGRCGTAYASIGIDIMPTEARGSISSVKPSGWQSVQYDNVEGKSLYNRCHLIGFQLAGENANKKNLVTGTRYMNVQGMLPFEDMVADYVKETENHVLYRVIPIFVGDELVPRGVTMEARSVEDGGEEICFYIYAYNEQPGIEINFADGTSRQKPAGGDIHEYIIGTNTHKFHLPECPSAAKIKDSNKELYKGTREDLVSQGYSPCKDCRP